ncbi:MAG TPA: phosphate ABC transporter permease subunit PstC [Erysipelotrichaceae bacterium]|nr:phosphate ABC transporter permease subunit PstC [Erysipelotrichaceae bacterium]
MTTTLIKSSKEKKRFKRIQDQFTKSMFLLSAMISSLMILVIILFIAQRGLTPFMPDYKYGTQDLFKFLFGMVWRQDQAIYGVGFIVINTLISGFAALILAFPIAVLTALFSVKIAPKKVGTLLETTIEILASIPSVVYGVFAVGSIVPMIQTIAQGFGIQTAGGSSMLAVILLLAIMILPTITSISITAIKAVDEDLEKASLALGATTTQTNFKIVLSAAKSGIFAGAILGLGRAFGEATAVSMVAGNKMFGPTLDFFDITRTMTSTMLAGLKETIGLDYDIRFSVGLVLMVVILVSNLSINLLKQRIGKQHA